MESLLLLIDFVGMFLLMYWVYQNERAGNTNLLGLFQFKQYGKVRTGAPDRPGRGLRRGALARRARPEIRRK
jgi:hypothetical protein